MKKLLFTFIISVLALDMSAQIQRTFLGNVLAVSTYEEVRTNMRNKGYEFQLLSIKIVPYILMLNLLDITVKKPISISLIISFPW